MPVIAYASVYGESGSASSSMDTGVMRTSYDTGPASMEGESGALDNVLTLNPNDDRWPAVLKWKDDATYTFTNVRVRQVSPGQFEVISAETSDESEPEAEDQAAERSSDKTTAKEPDRYSNPGVEALEM